MIRFREKAHHLQRELDEKASSGEKLKIELKDSFVSLATEALKGSNKELIQLAQLQMNQQQNRATSELDQKKSEINNIIEPLRKTLGDFFNEVGKMEKERQRSYALVEQELKKVVENNVELSRETRALKNALKKPHIRVGGAKSS